MICAHCNKRISCGCQKTKAADGQTVHKSCLAAYNKKTTSNVSSLTKTINKAKYNIRNGN